MPTGASPDLHTLSIRQTDCEALAEATRVAGWDQEYCQLRPGPFFGQVDVALIGGVQVARLHYDNQILARGAAPPGCVTLAVVTGQQGTARWRGTAAAPGLVMVAGPAGETDLLMGQTFELCILSVPAAGLTRGADVDHLVLPPQASRELARLVLDGLGVAHSHPDRLTQQASRVFADDALAVATSAFRRGSPGQRPAPALAIDLERALRSRTTEPAALPELCDELGTSERSLRRASQTAFGQGPMRLLKTLRLNALRRALRQADPATARVWEVAGRFGFWHMGQLARDYRALFGERPGDTLARAAGDGPRQVWPGLTV